ncbi:MAG TPA: thiolase family protein [Deltaproteobacteria bacterium]|nr:thiolase family protein [Candidatus Binatota bacterium]HIL14373.1 thiolase family protein [Deltaproteobacteria bacterium]
MREAVIVSSMRTGMAKSYRGSFNVTRPDELCSHALVSALDAVPNVDKSEIEDVVIGCGFPEGPQGMNVARVATLGAGLPDTVAATTVNRFCSSGLQAVAMAAHQVIAEGAEVSIGGGVESITLGQGQANQNGIFSEKINEKWPGVYMGMGDTAEVVAERYNISREDQDAFALRSQQRYAAALESGIMAEEIAPLSATWAKKNKETGETEMVEVNVDHDECNRPTTTLEGLASLKPVFKEDGSVTAGNASQMSDGASATVLMSAERAKQLDVQPMGVFRGFAVAGCRPEEMGIGPVFAVPKLLSRHGLKIEDIDIVELNEAFASQALYCMRELGITDEQINPNGGSIAIGHPYGMTGSRMVGHLLRELKRQGKRYGIVTMCIGGGQGMAGLFEAC